MGNILYEPQQCLDLVCDSLAWGLVLGHFVSLVVKFHNLSHLARIPNSSELPDTFRLSSSLNRC